MLVVIPLIAKNEDSLYVLRCFQGDLELFIFTILCTGRLNPEIPSDEITCTVAIFDAISLDACSVFQNRCFLAPADLIE